MNFWNLIPLKPEYPNFIKKIKTKIYNTLYAPPFFKEKNCLIINFLFYLFYFVLFVSTYKVNI